jgi:hypothetical protein
MALTSTTAGRKHACRSGRFAHHPDLPEYRADVYTFKDMRLCIGCFTTYPVFLTSASALVWWRIDAWPVLLAVGGLLAVQQGWSSLGLARWRPAKVVVKTCLGLGLALLVHGVLAAPWTVRTQSLVLLGFLGLAAASAIPRSLRMRAQGTP